MSEDSEQPASSGPTPEEISARLEALLKRTHALRRAQAPVDPEGPTWPPGDGDMASVDVVDLPATAFATPGSHHGAARAATSSADAPPPGEDALPPSDGPRSAATGGDAADADARPPEPASFGRPDWSTLRLREAPVEVVRTPGWIWWLVAALVVALGAETAYLVWSSPWATSLATTAAAPPSIRVEGPGGLQVSTGDGEQHPLPAILALPSTGEPRLVIEQAPATADAQPPGDSAAAEPAPIPDAASATPAPTATTGAVRIESTPSGAMVTMEGRERGPTPITIDGLRPGRHEVLVVGSTGGRLLYVDVAAGTTTRLDATTAPASR